MPKTENKGKMTVGLGQLKKSWIAKVFGIVFLCLIGMLTILVIGIFKYSRQTVGNEFIRLNQSTLSNTAYLIGRNLSDIQKYGKKVSVNSKLLTLMADNRKTSDARQKASQIVNELQSEFITSNMNGLSYIETYVVGKNGFQVSAYNSEEEKYTWEELVDDERLAPLLSGRESVVFLPTSFGEEETGIMKYSFQIVVAMRDLLDEQLHGMVIVEVSELFLFRQYREYLEESTDFTVIDSEGRIVSNSEKNEIGNIYSKKEETIQIAERINGSGWLIVREIPEKQIFFSLTMLWKIILLGILLYIVLAAVLIVWAAKMIFNRISCIKENMQHVAEGDLTVRIEVKQEDEFGAVEASFNMMVEKIDYLIKRIHQSERQKRIAEMDFMHSQIHSHFIFNTMTSIRLMLEMGKCSEAKEMILYFSKLLRQTLSYSDEFIFLHQEIEMLKNYVGLQSYRYQNRFEVEWNICEETKNCKVLKMLLQPIVENAIFHGMGENLVHILVSAYNEGEVLILMVEDDGVGMSLETQENILKKEIRFNHVGLANIRERLCLHYGKRCGIRVESQKGKGTRVTLWLPFDWEGEDEIKCSSGR